MPYERFTDKARKVMTLANQEAQRLERTHVDTEHLLLGLVKLGDGIAVNALRNLGIDLRRVRHEVVRLTQSPNSCTTGRLPRTPSAKKVLDYAMEEARNLDHKYVGTEHLLLGLLRECEGIAAQVLTNLGLKLEEIRREVLDILGSEDVEYRFVHTVTPSKHDEENLTTRVKEAVRVIKEGLQILEDAVRAADNETGQ